MHNLFRAPGLLSSLRMILGLLALLFPMVPASAGQGIPPDVQRIMDKKPGAPLSEDELKTLKTYADDLRAQRKGMPAEDSPKKPTGNPAGTSADRPPTSTAESRRAPFPSPQVTQSSAPGALGQLPPQFPAPSGSVDEVVAALAKEVLAGGSRSLPALMTALQSAGICIRQGETVLVPASQPPQGYCAQVYEVQAVATLIGSGDSVKLSDLANDLAGAAPELLGKAPLAKFILAGIRDSAQKGSGPLRSWARFIVELGRQSQPPYDLLDAGVGTDVPLNAAQLNLVLWRFSADLVASKRMAAPKSAAASGAQKTSGAGDVGTSKKSLTGGGAPPPPPQAQAAPAAGAQAGGGNLPCAMTDAEGFAMDFGAAVSNRGFGELMTYIEDNLDGKGSKMAGMAGNVTSVANFALAYIKTFYSRALFTGTITMDGAGPPLKRAMKGGEERTLTLQIKMNTGNEQLLNCTRIFLNAAGLDFNLPNDGAIEGADVQWELSAPDPSDTDNFMLEFKGGDPIHNNVTNKQGMVKQGIAGTKHKRAIKNPHSVRKTATVRANVALKRANLLKDLGEAALMVIGGPSGLLNLPATLLERFHTLPVSFTFPISDWTDKVAWKGWTDFTAVSQHGNYKGRAEVTFELVEERKAVETYRVREGTTTVTIDSPFTPPDCYYEPDHWTWNGKINPDDGWLKIDTTSKTAIKYYASGVTFAGTFETKLCCNNKCDSRPFELQSAWWVLGSGEIHTMESADSFTDGNSLSSGAGILTSKWSFESIPEE